MEKQHRAIVVDDEWLARRELRSMLEAHPSIVILGEASGLEDAAQLIREKHPDVVFLDIQLGKESGFELLRRVRVDFAVVFVTAYEEHAVRAFEVNALDYLLKPVVRERLSGAIDRLRDPEGSGKPSALPLEFDDWLFLKLGDRAAFLKINTIEHITTAGDYTTVYTTEGQNHLVEKSMQEWEERLPKQHFLRIHRSTLVNLEFVERIEPWSNYSYRVYLRGSEKPLVMSRRYAALAKDRLG